MRYLLTLLLLTLSMPASCIEISNFKSGLACTHTRLPDGDKGGWICQPTTDVLVTDQGTCVYNGQEKRCTWMGFEFDYRDAKEGQLLQGVTSTSSPVDSGNPKGIFGKDLQSESHDVPIKSGNGRFFAPQYFVFNTRKRGDPDAVIEQITSCSADGKMLFESKFRLVFPLTN